MNHSHSDEDEGQDDWKDPEEGLTNKEYHKIFMRCKQDCDPDENTVTFWKEFRACDDCKEEIMNQVVVKRREAEEFNKEHNCN